MNLCAEALRPVLRHGGSWQAIAWVTLGYGDS